MPPKPKIAIDIDSTLYSFDTVARETFLTLYEATGDEIYLKGAYVAWPEWRSPADVCGIDVWMDVIEACHEEEVILRQAPYPGAVETLNELYQDGYILKYVSARSEGSTEATYKWLVNSGFPMMPGGAELICQMGSKVDTVADCQFMIDDRPRTLIEFVYDHNWNGEQRKAFSLSYPYNQALTDIPNIYLAPTWKGIRMYLIRKGILNG